MKREDVLKELDTQLVTTADVVGAALKLGINAVYAGAKSGDIPSVRVGGRVRFPTNRIKELIGLPPKAAA